MSSSSFLSDINAVTDVLCKVQLSLLQQQAGLEEGGVSHSLEKGPARSCTVRFHLCPAVQSGPCLLQLLVLDKECITQKESLGCRINLCSPTIAGWHAWGWGKFSSHLCDLSGNWTSPEINWKLSLVLIQRKLLHSVVL